MVLIEEQAKMEFDKLILEFSLSLLSDIFICFFGWVVLFFVFLLFCFLLVMEDKTSRISQIT